MIILMSWFLIIKVNTGTGHQGTDDGNITDVDETPSSASDDTMNDYEVV